MDVLDVAGLAPQIPEDLYHLIKKAVTVRKHLERNRHDKDSKFRLILIESRIHRLARYYRTKSQLPPTFKFEAATASWVPSFRKRISGRDTDDPVAVLSLLNCTVGTKRDSVEEGSA
jgi:ribosomal protein S15P/S13E